MVRAAGEEPEEEGDSSEGDDDSDAVIDPDELEAELEEYVVLATCLHNDRSMHMIDPRLAAAVQADDSGGEAASMQGDEDEGDEPPYDLVPLKAVRCCRFLLFLAAACSARCDPVLSWQVAPGSRIAPPNSEKNRVTCRWPSQSIEWYIYTTAA